MGDALATGSLMVVLGARLPWAGRLGSGGSDAGKRDPIGSLGIWPPGKRQP